MKILLTTVALAATLASPAFAQTHERAAAHSYGQYVLQAPAARHSANGKDVYLPGDTINADAASRALMKQDDMKDCYLEDWCN